MKFLFKPLKPYKVNQVFGANDTCIKPNGFLFNKGYSKVCPRGSRSIYAPMKGHNGLDLKAKRHQPIYASQDGIVTEVVAEQRRGIGIGITTLEKFYCNETGKEEHFKIRYWHQSRNNFKLGDIVRVGDVVAPAGDTGYATGVHLHLEIKPVKVFKKNGKINKTDNALWNNGFYGTVDPAPYMHDLYAMSLADVKSVWDKINIVIGSVTGKPYVSFRKELGYGMRGNKNVAQMQDVLKKEGLFPTNIASSGNYLEITRKAVDAFQRKFKVAPVKELNYVKGRWVGKKTREALNLLVNK